MQKLNIAIPSYKRVEVLGKRTLPLLLNGGFSKEEITIFTANEEELRNYTKAFPEMRVILGVPTLHNQRNFIQTYYKEGEMILWCDDDLKKIQKAENNKLVDLAEGELAVFAKNAFNKCLEANSKIWGIYPAANAFFMKNTITHDLRHIVGSFYGTINTHAKETFLECEEKEDYERSIKFFLKFGKTTRFNSITAITDYYKTAGGMQVDRNLQRIKETSQYLMLRYPQFVKQRASKKNTFEIRIGDFR